MMLNTMYELSELLTKAEVAHRAVTEAFGEDLSDDAAAGYDLVHELIARAIIVADDLEGKILDATKEI